MGTEFKSYMYSDLLRLYHALSAKCSQLSIIWTLSPGGHGLVPLE